MREEIEQVLKGATEKVWFVEATQEAVRLGSSKVTNVIMLGAFSTLLEVPIEVWEEVILSRVPPRHVQLNKAAFIAGRKLLQGG